MRSLILILIWCCAGAGQAAPCGGDFARFVAAMTAEARGKGLDPASIDAFFIGARQNAKVLKADRAQTVFQKPFLDFARSLIGKNRLPAGRRKSAEFDAVFKKARADYGIPRGILLAFWAFETDYGQVQGDFNTRDALLTLGNDCRRPDLFQPQILAAVELVQRGIFDPGKTTGAWAGEIGMVQMLPADVLAAGVDGDGDGRISLKTSVPDALLSAANKLQALGWAADSPWLQEIMLPADFDWSLTGLDKTLAVKSWAGLGAKPVGGTFPAGDLRASVLLPQGRGGPAFLVYPNFNVLFDWNKSLVYVTTAAYFATRLEGAPALTTTTPEPGLSGKDIRRLQQKLAARGHDIGAVDGILGQQTRAAVQKEQLRLGLPADAWPDAQLLDAL